MFGGPLNFVSFASFLSFLSLVSCFSCVSFSSFCLFGSLRLPVRSLTNSFFHSLRPLPFFTSSPSFHGKLVPPQGVCGIRNPQIVFARANLCSVAFATSVAWSPCCFVICAVVLLMEEANGRVHVLLIWAPSV